MSFHTKTCVFTPPMFIIASETSFKDGMITKVSIYGTSYYEILLINKREHAIHTHNNFGVCTDN